MLIERNLKKKNQLLYKDFTENHTVDHNYPGTTKNRYTHESEANEEEGSIFDESNTKENDQDSKETIGPKITRVKYSGIP